MSNDRQLADQQARDRIASELDRNLLVEAGAGSGKTHEMARRMAAGIATGAYQVEHMSAVTFTRKAAAELRGRFQLALEDRAAARESRLRQAESATPTAMARSSAGFEPRCRISSASSRAPFTRSARTSFANVLSRQACRPASPSSTRWRTRCCGSSRGAIS